MENERIDINIKLVERAADGDQQAMYRLYKMYVPAMYNTCIRIVANKFDAEDIVQESFVAAFSKIGSFRGESTFGAWLKRIVINKSLNHLRGKRLSFVEFDNLNLKDEDPEIDGLPEIPMEAIHEGIKELPDKARVVLNLYLLEGYMHKEIAEMLGISESTSKSQYLRAKDLLKETLITAYEKAKS